MPAPNPFARAIELTQQLAAIIDETRADVERMPRIARPMVRGGFARRTGKSYDQWTIFVLRLRSDLEAAQRAGAAAPVPQSQLIGELRGLGEHYRTAPQRAARFVRGPELARIGQQSEARAKVALDLAAELEALAGAPAPAPG